MKCDNLDFVIFNLFDIQFCKLELYSINRELKLMLIKFKYEGSFKDESWKIFILYYKL